MDDTNYAPEATWVTHSDDPGADFPVAGKSLFGRLFGFEENAIDGKRIPYPFESLIDHLQNLATNRTKQNVIAKALIPIGRSLQRAAAEPDYFRFPRQLIVINGESNSASTHAGYVLKNRLFIAYQEKANQLEVISYNNDMGRFEFQVVNDYGPGLTPKIEYASRSLCMSCHQNGGPIFATTPWAESNFNPKVAGAIANAQPERYGRMSDAFSNDVHVIDIATDYANYLSTAQLLWQSGCGEDSPTTQASQHCRAALFRALLQYKLSGELDFDDSQTFYNELIETISLNWKNQWPNGLLIPSADIPDHNPFESDQDDPKTDPLSPRPPQAYWDKPDRRFVKGLVERLSGFLTLADIQRLDQRLLTMAKTESLKQQSLNYKCKLKKNDLVDDVTKLNIECSEQSQIGELSIELELTVNRNKITHSVIRDLVLPDYPLTWRAAFRQPKFHTTGNKNTIATELQNYQTETSLRFSTGARLQDIEITWQSDLSADQDSVEDANVSLNVIEDFVFLDQALLRMLEDSMAGDSDAFSYNPVQRKILISELRRNLGMEKLIWQ